MLQAGESAEGFALRRPGEPRLKADQIERGPLAILFAKLHDGIRSLPGSRIAQPDGLERTEPQYLISAVGHLFNRQTPFEIGRLLEVLRRVAFQRTKIAD